MSYDKRKQDITLDDSWTKTPDMGEYLDNDMVLDLANKIASGTDGGQYFIESPFTTELGYHEADNVFVISGQPASIVDGDTVKIKYDTIIDGGKQFEFLADGLVYKDVKTYLYNTLDLNSSSDDLSVRILGINAPEVPHYGMVYASKNSDIIYVKFGDLISNTNVKAYRSASDDKFYTNKNGEKVLNQYGLTALDKSNFHFMYYDYKFYADEGETFKTLHYYKARTNDTYVRFLVSNAIVETKSTQVYYEILPDYTDDKNDIHFDIKDEKDKKEFDLDKYRICYSHNPSDGNAANSKYHIQALAAKEELRKKIYNATEVLYILDCTTFKHQKETIPEPYRGDAIRLSDDPTYAFEYVYNMVTGKEKSYTRLGYGYFGQDYNKRALGAIYIKYKDDKYGEVWINAAKYLAFMNDQFTILPSYSTSPSMESSFNYNSSAFKLWSYDPKSQLYIDQYNDFHSEKGGDDRDRIQKELVGCNIEELKDYTVLIGDCLLMIPPTSIRMVSQTNSQRTSLIRSKGAITKSIPKTERVMEIQLYFNGEEGINGIPYDYTMPNGNTIKYHMNGLRALVAQFKFTPYLPITNTYINQVLNIEAVTLNSIQINTVPNFPKTIQATIKLVDFQYRQFLPEILPPNIDNKEDITMNLFAQTIHFPVMRYYYQRAILNGEAANLLEFNTDPYLEATLGQKTVLQPMKFNSPLIDFYIANENHLKQRKQLKEALMKKPFETVVVYTDKEKEFLLKVAKLNSAVRQSLYKSEDLIAKINKAYNSDTDYFTAYRKRELGDYNFNEYGEGKYGFHSQNKKPKVFFDEYLKPLSDNLKTFFNDTTSFDPSILKDYGIVYREYNKANDFIEILYGIKLVIDWAKCSENLLRKVKQQYGKSFAVETEIMFVDDAIVFGFSSQLKAWSEDKDKFKLEKPFEMVVANGSTEYDYINIDTNVANRIENDFSIVTDEKGNILTDTELSGDDLFNQNKELAEMKDSIDLETTKSMVFDKFPIENCIVENISIIYNNNFNKMSLSSMDGYTSQYIGASDTMLDINIKTRDQATVTNFQVLSRKCVNMLLEYRKIMTCSPLRIDCELARFIGVNEVILESIEVNTVPNFPELYDINIRLASVDRTLRNREALKKIDDIDNSATNNDTSLKAKNFFSLNAKLKQVELYPDLELPTIEELERLGYYFIRYKNSTGRLFPDADFYFVYLHAYSSEMFRKSIVEFFNNNSNETLKQTISGDLYGGTKDINLHLNSKPGDYLITDAGEKTEYDTQIQSIYDASSKVLTGEGAETTKENEEKISATKQKVLDKNEVILNLKESISSATYATYDFNHKIKIAINENIPYGERLDLQEVKDINNTLKKMIKEILQKPIEKRNNSFISKNSFPEMDDLFNYLTKDVLDIGTLSESFANIDKDGHFVANAKLFLYNDLRVALSSAATGKTSALDYKSSKLVENKDQWIGTSSIIAINKDGSKENVRNVLKIANAQDISSYVIVDKDEDINDGIIFGPFGIRKYDPRYLGTIYKMNIQSGEYGFLDPYYNKTLYNEFFKEEITAKKIEEFSDDRIKEYIEGISEIEWDNKQIREADFHYSTIAMYRILLVWFYKLLDDENQSFLPKAFYYFKNISKTFDDFSDKQSFQDKNNDAMLSHYNPGYWLSKGASAIGETITSIFGDENTKQEVEINKEINEKNEELTAEYKQMKADLKAGLKVAKINLLSGLFTTLGALAIGEFNTPIYQSVVGGNLSDYSNYIETIKSSYIYPDALTNEVDLKMRRFFSCLDIEEYANKNELNSFIDPLKKYGSTSATQRKYIEAADTPSIYLMHSFYDMVTHDMRGRMARAFPTYYMLLIDEGRSLGAWHLQDNFYDVSSISEFQVVKSRKVAADTASISMTNLFGTFTSEDEDMKDEYQYTFKDAWNSIFSPRPYFAKEYERRVNARDFNRAKLKAGARLHLRMGYEGDASKLPIMFNGCIAEVQTADDMINIVCQGDGIELANPAMFNAADVDNVANLSYTDDMFGGLYGLFNNETTPRDILVNPLIASGSFIQSLIRDWSNSRFFNDNPFGIVHFGDKYYKEVFLNNGEMEQNIYEAINKPSWGKSGDISFNESLWSMETAPKIRVNIDNGRSYWDLMNIAASVSPETIAAIAPFQLRSTIFYGAPRYYYAYDYEKTAEDKIVEKRKPFQQYHIYTSFTDIIGNTIAASSKDIRTVAVGVYKDDGLLTSKTKSVGPLYLDIDIYPENQTMTTINCDFEHRSFDLPITVPVVGAVKELWSEDGYKTAWRATANGLKNTVKDMYTGELIIMGDPSIKPYDKMMVYDTYQDIQGVFDVEAVVHTFSIDTGFTTSISPDCVVAVDDKYEKIAHNTIKSVALPVISNLTTVILLSARFANITRSLFFAASQSVKGGVKFTENIVNGIKKVSDASELANYSPAADKVLGSLGSAFGATASDYMIFSSISSLEKAYKALPGKHTFSASTDLVKFLQDISKQTEAIKKLDPTSLKTKLQEAHKETSALLPSTTNKTQEVINQAITKSDEYIAAYNKAKSSLGTISIDSEYITAIFDAVPEAKWAEIPETKKFLEGIKDTKLIASSENFEKAIQQLMIASNHIDDFEEGSELLKYLDKLDDTIFVKSAKSMEKFSDLGEVFKDVNKVKKGKGIVTAAMASNLLWLAAEIVLTKFTQEYIERKLKNLQVLTVFPVMKNGTVMTAGLNGNKGSVFGSPTYGEPGFIEEMAINFFDGKYGSVWPLVTSFLVNTSQMKEIVDGYRRNSSFENATGSETVQKTSVINNLMNSVVNNEVKSINAYKQLFLDVRVSDPMSQEGRIAYKTNCLLDIEHPESDKKIRNNLVYIFKDDILKQLNSPSNPEKQVLLFAAQQNTDKKDSSGNTYETCVLSIASNTEGSEQNIEVRCKKIQQSGEKYPVYDIPFLRPHAQTVLAYIIERVVKKLQPDATSENSTLDNLHKHNIIVHNCTRINEKSSWYNTGFSFSIQVKDYNEFGNILKEISDNQDAIISENTGISKVFNYKIDPKMGDNTYTIMVSPAL